RFASCTQSPSTSTSPSPRRFFSLSSDGPAGEFHHPPAQ
uniref:Uncharacterized protein n=1 Tax=Aegilops tauschii subsp. strangulata TaxID=200361 RepID=A0A453I2J1_AEGTS